MTLEPPLPVTAHLLNVSRTLNAALKAASPSFCVGLVGLALAGCTAQSDSGTGGSSTVTTPSRPQIAAGLDSGVSYSVQPLAGGLEFPWGLALLPDGSMLVTEREGRLRLVKEGAGALDPVAGAPAAYVDGQGGYLDVEVDPDFANNRYIYLAFSQGSRAENRTVVVRAKLSADAMSLTEVSEIFRAQPSKQGGAHFGARLLFLPDSTLLISLGDGFRWMNEAQKPDNHFGKIVRINSDGSIPADNPGFDGTSAAGVFSIGHRNVQGLARDPQTGTLYAVEHGPKGGDELNRIEAGRNYGWPVISYGINYDGSILTSETAREGMEQPLTYWVPSIATSSLLFYSGEAFPAWKGDLFVGALAGMKVERVDIENGTVMGREALFEELEQRIRSVDQAPDGSLILLTDALDGQVLRIAPAR